MLSFFSKKKQSPDSPQEEAIQGPADPTRTNENEGGGADDFIFIERKPTDNDPSKFASPGMRMYPPMPPMFGGGGYPGQSPIYPPKPSTNDTATPVPYVHGIPFELAPQLSSKNDFEVTQLQVDSILALLTRQMSIDESEEYNFSLERSIQNECY